MHKAEALKEKLWKRVFGRTVGGWQAKCEDLKHTPWSLELIL